MPQTKLEYPREYQSVSYNQIFDGIITSVVKATHLGDEVSSGGRSSESTDAERLGGVAEASKRRFHRRLAGVAFVQPVGGSFARSPHSPLSHGPRASPLTWSGWMIPFVVRKVVVSVLDVV